ncbi:MAG: hypothetical protein GXP26_08735 [Planctomycetes bacterium]|nr:hypothetical protein [Planctomycetota bacterium]
MNSLPAEQPTSLPEPPAEVSTTPSGKPPGVCADPEQPPQPGNGPEKRRFQPTMIASAVEAWVVAGRSSSLLASALLHTGIVLLLSLFILTQPRIGPPSWLEGAFEPDMADEFDLNISELDAASGDISSSKILRSPYPPLVLWQRSARSILRSSICPRRPRLRVMREGL